MTYHAKLPFCQYKQHFQSPKGVDLHDLFPIKIVVEFVVVENDLDRMNLKWQCQKFFKQGVLDEIKCEEVKKDIFKWIQWVRKDSFDNRDLL